MRTILLAVLLSAAPVSAMDHLEPERPVFDMGPNYFPFLPGKPNIFTRFDGIAARDVWARVIVTPSFSPAHGMAIRGTALEAWKMTSADEKRAKVEHCRVPLARGLWRVLLQDWDGMLLQTRPEEDARLRFYSEDPERTVTVTADGTAYHFAMEEFLYGVTTGGAAGSKVADFAGLADTAWRACFSGAKADMDDLAVRADALLARLPEETAP